MGSFGECFCGSPECCLATGDYPQWDGYQPGTCCRVCEFSIAGDPWTLLCSDPIRTDIRFAEAEYKYYTTPHPVAYADDPNPPDCGDPIAPQTLCSTITESHEVVVIERLIMRYRKISQSSSIAKIQITCGSDPNNCRWIVSSQICLEVEYGQFEFRSEDHDVTISGNACCKIINPDYLKNIHTAMPTCAAKAGQGFPSSTTICLKRLKVFDTAPSGTITFADGDWIACEDIGICIRSGVQSFCVASTDFGMQPWTAPACAQFNAGGKCIALEIPFANCCTPPLAAGTFVGEQQSTTCYISLHPFFCLYEWNGTQWVPVYDCSLVSGADISRKFAQILYNTILTVPGWNSLSNLGVYYDCKADCNGDLLTDKFISEVKCTLLSTPYHPTPTYIARTLCITLPSWSVNLGACP